MTEPETGTAVPRRGPAVSTGAVLAGVLVIGLAAMAGRAGDQPTPQVPWDANGDYTKDGVTFRQQVQGDALLHASIGDVGQTAVRFDVIAPAQGLRLSPVCHGVSADHQVTVSLNGILVSGQSCRVATEADPGSRGMRFLAEPEHYLRELGVEPGDVVRARAWISHADDPAQTPVRHRDAVVGLGLYEDRHG